VVRAVVIGNGHYLPERILPSTEVEDRVRHEKFRMPAGMIELITGIKERRHAPEDATSSDMGAFAAVKALEMAGIDPLDIDLLIASSATHDCADPSTASITQSKIGATNAMTMDVKNACAGFLNGLDVAASFIETGRAKRILVTAGEVLSSVIDWNVANMADMQTKFAGLTLGDGGAAYVLEAQEDTDRGVYEGAFVADGAHWALSTVLGGGTLKRQTGEGMYFSCRSGDLAGLAVEHLPKLVIKQCERLGWDWDSVKLAVPHQVARGVIDELCERLNNFPTDRVAITLDRLGNVAAASIPIALSMAAEEGRIVRGDKILLIGGAAGFSGGVVPVVW
jgi:3-oxoacyl-[acyl-carrier-protein] synthase-3